MIKLMSSEDDYFASPVDALVNPVNCEGIMGAGLALAFKKRYPKMFEKYKEDCAFHVYDVYGMMGLYENDKPPIYIINFPTKNLWDEPSRIEYIQDGIPALRFMIRDYNISSIAIPALGCGLGGLDWADVKPLIEDMAKLMPDVVIYLYPPR